MSAVALRHVDRARESLRMAAEATEKAAREMLAAGAAEDDLEAVERQDRGSTIGYARIAIELSKMSATLRRWGADPEEARRD